MSLRLQMLQVARLARRTLGDSAPLVVSFLESQALPGGGYADRGGRPDLYYTAFALDALTAVDAAPAGERAADVRRFLAGFGAGDGLDFVHRCCLARAWAALAGCGKSHPWPVSTMASPEKAEVFRDSLPLPPAADEVLPALLATGAADASLRSALLAGIARHRAADGGYNSRGGAARGTAYGCFLAVNARADLGFPLDEGGAEAAQIVSCLESLRSADGGWSNAGDQAEGSTTATAAAIATLRGLGRPVPAQAGDWLLARRHPAGGFTAAADAPIPDLLSTAVALHALDAIDVPWREHRDSMLDFLDTLWTAEGAFHGSWADDQPDAEYTFYGLVALGHASV